jgi:hypothetical protein
MIERFNQSDYLRACYFARVRYFLRLRRLDRKIAALQATREVEVKSFRLPQSAVWVDERGVPHPIP